MKCPNHSQNEVSGYCSVCGGFGCSECLTLHEGNLLCPRHYKPIADKAEAKKKHPRKLLVVRYADGRREYGVAYALNLREVGFHLDMMKADGSPLERTQAVRFKDLKAVFIVKSFDGKFEKKLRFKEWTPEGEPLVVKFQDGETLRGRTMHHVEPEDERFYLIPDDPETNNIAIIVERKAVAASYTVAQFEEQKAMEREASREPVPLR